MAKAVKTKLIVPRPVSPDGSLAPCFVIAPSGDEGAVKARRTQWIMKKFIAPACERAGLKPQNVQQLIEDLRSDRMVIAYLGKPPWKPNVMIEVAYRLATGMPIVFLRDTPRPGEEKAFPFDLKDHPIILLPPEGTDTDDDPNTVRKLADAIQQRSNGASSWLSAYAVASIDMHVGAVRQEEHVFIEASPEAEKLFDMGGQSLTGYPIINFLKSLDKKMPAFQVSPFLEEQDRLINELVVVKPFTIIEDTPARRAKAKVPMVFTGHSDPDYRRRAFLPIILQHHMSSDGTLLRLKVLYLNVTASVRRADPPNRHFVCDLFTPTDPLDLGSIDQEEVFPVFCAYSGEDKEAVEKIVFALQERGLTPKPRDTESILAEDIWEMTLRKAISRVKGVVVFFGRAGAGEWGENELGVLNKICAQREIPLATVLLPEARSIPAQLQAALGGVPKPIRFSSPEDEGALPTLVQRLRKDKAK